MSEAMREFGFGDIKNCELVGVSPQIGVRESRRIQGGYILTEEDAQSGKKFDDVIAWRSGFLDIGFVRVTPMRIHQVPYRSIVPEQIDGLLAAGRCISATHEGASAGKSMGNCFATGHAAGVAASLCSKGNKVPREIDVKQVQAILTADGVDLSKGGEDQDRLEHGGEVLDAECRQVGVVGKQMGSFHHLTSPPVRGAGPVPLPGRVLYGHGPSTRRADRSGRARRYVPPRPAAPGSSVPLPGLRRHARGWSAAGGGNGSNGCRSRG